MSDIKDRARRAVRHAIERGVLIRPSACVRCGDIPASGRDGRSCIHAHHYAGYDRPLDVEWLCVRCHFKEDRRPAGADNGRAKCTTAVVAEIRSRYRQGATHWNPSGGAKLLAREFGVSDRTVRRIMRGEIWPDAALSPKE